MILVTVGAQEPFDRLVRTVDDWAARRGIAGVFAQIGQTAWRPRHVEWALRLEPEEFRRRAAAAQTIVAHAGMGTILTALELGKPILVMPRRAALRETRNDHQWGTAERMRERGWLEVARDERELAERLDHLVEIRAPRPIPPHAPEPLIGALRSFIQENAAAVPAGAQ